MLVSSRSLAEYRAMFDLGDADLRSAVADCAAGASSFVAEVDAVGGRVLAFDPAYALPRARLTEVAQDGNRAAGEIVDRHRDRFVWDWYDGSPAKRDQLLRDRCVDLALCSHLLFTWSNDLGMDWHFRTLLELTRVAREVRVFPLVAQGSGEPVGFLDPLRAGLAAAGVRTSVRRVPYEFQRGGDAMLVAYREAGVL